MKTTQKTTKTQPTKKTKAKVFAAAALVGVLTATLSGCGGGGHAATAVRSTRSQATFTVNWPARTTSRLIPQAANSISVAIIKDGKFVQEKILVRPTDGVSTTANFTNLPVGDFMVKAAAYPSQDGSGVAEATATTTMTISDGKTTNITLTLNSTITSLSLEPNKIATLIVGQSQQLSVTAKDTDGNIVLTSAGQFSWSESGASQTALADAALVSGGLVKGNAPGDSVVRVTDSESGLSTSAQVHVSLTALLNGTIFAQVQFPSDPLLPPALQNDPSQIHSYLVAIPVVNGVASAPVVLISKSDSKIYSPLNPRPNATGDLLTFSAINCAVPGTRNPDVDHFEAFILPLAQPNAVATPITAGMYPQSRVQDPMFAFDNTLMLQTNQRVGPPALHLVTFNPANLTPGSGIETPMPTPLSGVQPLWLSSSVIAYMDPTNYGQQRVVVWRAGAGVTPVTLPGGYGASYFPSPLSTTSFLMTVKVADGSPDRIATVDLGGNPATPQATEIAFDHADGGSTYTGGNDSDPAWASADGDLVLFARTGGSIARYRLFVGQRSTGRVEQIVIPGLAADEAILGASFVPAR